MATAGGRQEEEVAQIKEQFPGRCRVLTQVGEHAHSVTLQPQDRDATIKFLLKASYPDSAPQVAVRSGSLGDGVSRQLEQLLEKEAQTRLGGPMLAELLALAETWLSEAGFEPTTPASPGKKGGDKGKKKRAKKGKKKPHDESEDGESKLPSMRTADDVIKRIQWDDNLDKDDFVVGYVDRFRGLMEKYFSAFSWEDLASVDYNVLAVPRHRIQYFKYRGVVVWDKPSRLDHVFGSTGSKVTITDVIENYEDFAQRQAASGVGAAGAAGGAAASANPEASACAAPDSGNSGSHYYDDDDDDDDDSDDGINVTIGFGTQASAARAEEVSKPTSYVLVREDKQWPTHFLSVRITDEETVRAVKVMQDFIVEREPLYDECVMPPATLHMTLCTLGLDTPQHVEVAIKLLQKMAEDWRSHRPRRPIVFHGVSHFNKQVLYAKVKDNHELLDFVDHVMKSVRSAGLEIRDSYKFVPHMTIMKVSSPVAKKKQSKEVDPRLYEKFLDRHFGSQTLDTILLCSMGGERGKDGFYVCQSQINLTA